MAGNKFIKTGTLAGATVTIDIFNTGKFVAKAVLIKNDHTANTYQVNFDGNTGDAFPLKPREELRMRGDLKQVSLLGTGDYRLIAVEDVAELPDLEYAAGTSGATASPADGVTIEDTGAVIRVKDQGITQAKLGLGAVDTPQLALLAVTNAEVDNATLTGQKVNKGIFASQGIPASGYLYFSGNPGDGDTVQIAVAGGQDVTYEFDNNAAVTPGNILVTIGAGASDTALNLKNAIDANQTDVRAVRTGAYVDINVQSPSLIKAGASITVTEAVAGLDYRNNGSQRAEQKVSVFWALRSVDAMDVTRTQVNFALEAIAIYSAIVQVLDSAGVMKFCDAVVSIGGNNVSVVNQGTPDDFALNDYIQVIAVGTIG